MPIGSESLLMTLSKATRGLLATNLVILSHCQVTRTTAKLATPSLNFHAMPKGELRASTELTYISPSTQRVFSATRLLPMTLRPYSRAFGDGPRNFEPWSSDEDDTGAGTQTLLATTPH
ncbi:hypothetical protein TNCV_3094711 [Trichonephila clavipes]|nr:hypothetical protein TNCV_3094711 [Trichonephila clavipes]